MATYIPQFTTGLTPVLLGLVTAASISTWAAEPTVPSLVSVVGETTNRVRITWVDGADDETGFVVERSTDNRVFVAVGSAPANATNFIDNGVAPGTLYFYRVAATNGAGRGEWSNWNYGLTPALVASDRVPSTYFYEPAAAWRSDGSILLTWEDIFGDETGFEISRSTDNMTYALIATVAADTQHYVDSPPVTLDTTYYYRVRAVNTQQQSGYSLARAAVTRGYWGTTLGNLLTSQLNAPTNLTVTAVAPGVMRLRWNDTNDNESKFVVLRSWTDTHFEVAATLGANVTQTDVAVPLSDRPVYFRVAACTTVDGKEEYSRPTPSIQVAAVFDATLAAPSNVRAAQTGVDQASGAAVYTITWQDNASNETGFVVGLAQVGLGFEALATVGPDVVTCTVTSTVLPMYAEFVVMALSGNGWSRPGDVWSDSQPQWFPPDPFNETANPTAQPVSAPGVPDSGAVTVVVKDRVCFQELHITGTAGNDRIELSQSGDTITLVANGSTTQHVGPFGDILVRGRAGNDTIIVQNTVTLRCLLYGDTGEDALNHFGSGKAYLVTIGGGNDVVVGNGINTSYWTDQAGVDVVHASSAEIQAGRVHRITSFYKGVTKEPDPGNLDDSDKVMYKEDFRTQNLKQHSLWGPGPSMLDVNQGFHQNCPSTGEFQTFADQEPKRLEEFAADLGDGTYAVQYGPPAAQTYCRIDADFQPVYLAEPGPGGAIWWLVLEKSLGWGYSLGLGSWTYRSGAGGGDAMKLYQESRQAFRAGRYCVTGANGTRTFDVRVVPQSHVYALMETFLDADGTPRFIVRNPYGTQFMTRWPPDHPYLGLVTLNYEEFVANFGRAVSVEDRRFPPAANAGPDQNLVDADLSGAEAVTLDAGASYHRLPLVAFEWFLDGALIATGATPTVTLPRGLHTISLVVTDTEGCTGRDDVIVAISRPDNQSPIAANDAFAVARNTAALLDVLANDTDADGDPLALVSVTQPPYGTGAVRIESGQVLYLPPAGYTGAPAFTYCVVDAQGAAATGTVNLVVSDNQPPLIDSAAWADPTPVTLPAGTTVHVVAHDPDGDPLTYAWSQVSGAGTATFAASTSADSGVTFSTAGSCVLRVTVCDNRGGSVISDVTVTVNAAGYDSDTDGDGLFESVDPDDDNDGMSDVDEAVAGTDPTNRLSVLCVSAPEFHAPSSEFVIRWQSAPGKYYAVQAATNLLEGFGPMNGASNIPSAYPVDNVYTDDTANVGMRFYRLRARE